MLIKERLAIPIKTNQSTTIHWWVLLGAAVLISIALRDITLKTFGLDILQTLMELALTTLVICLPAITLMGIVAVMWHVLKWDTSHGILLSAIALLPLVIFLLYAHLEMSRALAPLKIEFSERAAGSNGQDDKTSSLVAITQVRDRLLANHGYVRLGGWRTSGNECDCTAIYLFVGAF